MRQRLFGSLLGRVFLLHAVLLALAAIFVPFVIDLMLRDRIEYFETRVLRDHADALGESLAPGADGAPRLTQDLRARPDWAGDEFIYAVIDGDGAVLLASAPQDGVALSRATRADRPATSSMQYRTGTFDVLTRPVTIGARAVWLVVGWNMTDQDVIFDDVAQGFLWRSLALSVPLLALLLVLDGLVIRRFFRPVIAVARDVQAIDPAHTDARLSLDRLPAEIRPLAEAFNAALERVEHGYQLQKEFTADAAHELRTPLAVLEARLQTLPPGEARTALLDDVRRMSRIVSQLLDMAILDQVRPETDETTDLIAVSRSLLAALGPEAIRKGQDLGLEEPEGAESVPVRVREEDIWHLLRNLIENAIRHTPPGTRIDVVVEAGGTLIVRDDGPGIPAALQPQIFKRFWRRRRSGGSGAGLGMAIVQRVVTAAGGTIELRSAEGQGTAFIIHLPPAPAA